LNLKRKTFLLENKSEKSENEFPEVSIPNFNGNKDGVELNEDLNITLSSSSISIPFDESHIEATLKCLRKTCRLGNTSFNVDVEMVNLDPNHIRLPQPCKILIAEMQIQNFLEIVLKCSTKFSEKKSMEHVIRENVISVNNACSINFKSLRMNKESFCAYAYCQDPACNFYKFQGSFNGNVKMFSKM